MILSGQYFSLVLNDISLKKVFFVPLIKSVKLNEVGIKRISEISLISIYIYMERLVSLWLIIIIFFF